MISRSGQIHDATNSVSLDIEEAFRRHRGDLERWAARMGGPLVDAEDVAQEVMMVAHARLPEFRHEANQQMDGGTDTSSVVMPNAAVVPQTGGSGGAGWTTPPSSGGEGGASCSNMVPCGGDVVGTWTVTSSCLKVSGQVDLSMFGLGCASAPVTGSLQVTGTLTAESNGTYWDNTTTSGDEVLSLPASCLEISGTFVTCDPLASLLQSLGYASVSCTSAAGGGCTCSATVNQTGSIGLVSIGASTSGKFKTSGNVVTLDGAAEYAYCVSGNTMTLTPQTSSPTTTGAVVF